MPKKQRANPNTVGRSPVDAMVRTAGLSEPDAPKAAMMRPAEPEPAPERLVFHPARNVSVTIDIGDLTAWRNGSCPEATGAIAAIMDQLSRSQQQLISNRIWEKYGQPTSLDRMHAGCD